MKLCLVIPVTGLPVRVPEQKFYVSWGPGIAHISLTHGHLTGDCHITGGVTSQKDLLSARCANAHPFCAKRRAIFR